jgi:signal transduction histidine kinase
MSPLSTARKQGFRAAQGRWDRGILRPMSARGARHRIGSYLRRHTPWVGFTAVLLPLVVLLALQLVWLKRLQETSAIARRAALHSALEAAGSEVQYFYRSVAERVLNVPSELFMEERVDVLAGQWSGKDLKGIARMFVADFTRSVYGEYRVLDPAGHRLVPFAASDEAMAIIAAATPFQMSRIQHMPLHNAAIRVDERSSDYRIMINPVTDHDGQVLGVVGMILDPDFLRKKLLPEVINRLLREFFPGAREGDIDVMVTDALGRLMHGAEHPAEKADVVTTRLPLVFTDWTLVLHSHRSTPERWARENFAINITLVALLATFLVGGIVLTLRSADRAMRLSEMKSDFVSNVSHELRTPVASIRVFAELLRLGRVQSPDKVREYGEFIERESRRLSRLIDNILDFARIESGRKTYSFAPVDVRVVVEATLQSFAPHLRHHGFTAHLEAPDRPLPEVTADADALAQALHNLLDNAVKYSGESRAIEVSLSHLRDEVIIAVHDHGVGIAREEQAKIFERFHRVGTALLHDVKGSGLGLSLVQHIVEVHGGRVTVVSEPGKGSTFSIRLPAQPPAAGTLPVRDAARGAGI